MFLWVFFLFSFYVRFLGACLPLIPPTWFLHHRMKLNRDCQSSFHRIQKVRRFVIFCSECLFSTSLIFGRLLSCEIVFHFFPPINLFLCVVRCVFVVDLASSCCYNLNHGRGHKLLFLSNSNLNTFYPQTNTEWLISPLYIRHLEHRFIYFLHFVPPPHVY